MGAKESKRKLLAILGGDLAKDATGKWQTTTFEDAGDKFGLLGDRLRVVAGCYLYSDDPQLCLVVLGGESDNWGSGAPSIAMVMNLELIALGVPREAILTERGSRTTHEQLLGLQKVVQEGQGDSMLILSNEYHLKRVQAMVESPLAGLPTLKALLDSGQLKLQAAEEILIERNPEKWQAQIKTVYASKAMQKRIKREEKGVRQIHKGTYQLR